jgi:hypothetical protein
MKIKICSPLKGLDNTHVDAARAAHVDETSAPDRAPSADASTAPDAEEQADAADASVTGLFRGYAPDMLATGEREADAVRPPSRLKRRRSFTPGAHQARRMTEFMAARRSAESDPAPNARRRS